MTDAQVWPEWAFGLWRDAQQVRSRLAAGADPDAEVGGSGRPLHIAAAWGTPATVAELAAASRDIDAVHEGRTALWTAVQHGNDEVARVLVAAGADPWLPMMAGWSPGRLSLAGPTPDLFVLPPAVPHQPPAPVTSPSAASSSHLPPTSSDGPSAPPSAGSSSAPSPASSAVPSAAPSPASSAVPSAAPSPASSAVPSAAFSPASSADPSAVGSGRLSPASSADPSAVPSAALSPAEAEAVRQAKQLIEAVDGDYYDGFSLCCVSGIDAAEAIRRLDGTVIDYEEPEDPDLDDGNLIVGVTDVPGGCVVTQRYGYVANTPGVSKRLSAGTVCYAMYANPKSGDQGSAVRDGTIVGWDLHPGGTWVAPGTDAEEILRTYLFRGEPVAYCCAYAGVRPLDARPFIGTPDLWVQLPARNWWKDEPQT